MIRKRRRKCQFCKGYFLPKPNNSWHQEYCEKSECRMASKKASQYRWLNKEENQNYFRCDDNVKRVQQWRKTRPGYWRTKNAVKKTPLQDFATEQPLKKTNRCGYFGENALQDLVSSQPTVLIGIIAQLMGSTLQDDIENMVWRLHDIGNDIIHFKGGSP